MIKYYRFHIIQKKKKYSYLSSSMKWKFLEEFSNLIFLWSHYSLLDLKKFGIFSNSSINFFFVAKSIRNVWSLSYLAYLQHLKILTKSFIFKYSIYLTLNLLNLFYLESRKHLSVNFADYFFFFHLNANVPQGFILNLLPVALHILTLGELFYSQGQLPPVS